MGDGENRWPLVHREDVGRLYRWVAESRGRGIFHAVVGTALLNANGGLVVFARGGDNAIWHAWQDQPDGNWA